MTWFTYPSLNVIVHEDFRVHLQNIRRVLSTRPIFILLQASYVELIVLKEAIGRRVVHLYFPHVLSEFVPRLPGFLGQIFGY